jgi:hypothetical protein
VALYRPPNKVVTTTIPWLTEVIRADPDWEKKKHWEPEYVFSSGKVKFADPYKRGAYNTPDKTNFVNYAGPTTFNAGDITNVGYDFVTTVSENATPGQINSRSASQMFSDIAAAVPNIGYALRIVNFGGTSLLTFAPDPSIIMFDGNWWGQQVLNDQINPGNYSEYQVQFPTPVECLIRRVSTNEPYSAIVG